MKKTSKPKKKNRALTSAVLWTFIAVIWTITAARNIFCYPASNRNDFLTVVVALISVVDAVGWWHTWYSQRKAENSGDEGGCP